jgi:succinyl-CoA synthetase beta subunit
MVNDRSLAKPILILSSTGGIEIERVALTSPDNIEKAAINPYWGCRTIPCARWPPGLELTLTLESAPAIAAALWKLFDRLDATLVEINPLVVTRKER